MKCWRSGVVHIKYINKKQGSFVSKPVYFKNDVQDIVEKHIAPKL